MANTDKPFLNKVVWITGASSGIGEALCFKLSLLGASLIISARNKKELERVNATLPVNPGEAKVLVVDLEDLEKLDAITSEAVAFFNRIDYLINNAGLAIRDMAQSTAFEVERRIMDINYWAPVILTKNVLPSMIDSGFGHIVVISSLSGKYGIPRAAAYAASKHALHGFFESLRSELNQKDVSISLIIPGIIKTGITANALTGTGDKFGKIEAAFINGYPADKAAKKIVKAILDKKEEAFVGGTEGITLWINRISQWLLRRIICSHPLKIEDF